MKAPPTVALAPSILSADFAGIHVETAPRAVEAGARVLVAGSAVFEDPAGIAAAMDCLRRSLAGSLER